MSAFSEPVSPVAETPEPVKQSGRTVEIAYHGDGTGYAVHVPQEDGPPLILTAGESYTVSQQVADQLTDESNAHLHVEIV